MRQTNERDVNIYTGSEAQHRSVLSTIYSTLRMEQGCTLSTIATTVIPSNRHSLYVYFGNDFYLNDMHDRIQKCFCLSTDGGGVGGGGGQ